MYGDGPLRWLYTSPVGRKLADHLFSTHWVSSLYGGFQSSWLSRHHIQPFIRQFHIPMEEYEEKSYQNFNDFFIRKFKPGQRNFVQAAKEMPSFAEARYLAYDQINEDQKFPVKGSSLSAAMLLGSQEEAAPFNEGPMLLARLCPTDYHRFHFPDSGEILKSFRIGGRLHSVNPIALKYRNEIFATNERQVSILKTENFGKLAYIEVGALCVGKIVQTHIQPRFKRGDEKGYFLFGASTVIVLGEKGAWLPDRDLIEKTGQGRETLVTLGDRVAFGD